MLDTQIDVTVFELATESLFSVDTATSQALWEPMDG